MDHGHHRQQLHQHHHRQYSSAGSIDTAGTNNSGGGDRFPQWSVQETRDFLMIRAELDPTFMETKRNKLLWELISTRMKEKGYGRSPDQCKCKWKNLVTRYKGCETMEAEGLRQQFPFYNEMQAIFAARMERMLWLEAEGGGGGSAASASKKKAAAASAQFSSSDEDENEDSESELKGVSRKKRKTAIKGNTSANPIHQATTELGNPSNSNTVISAIKDMFDEYAKQQMQIEMQWFRAYEEREEERKAKEMEWRQTMEALENERIMMDRRWREREEQRRVRDEARAEKRDALITALLNKLRREDH